MARMTTFGDSLFTREIYIYIYLSGKNSNTHSKFLTFDSVVKNPQKIVKMIALASRVQISCQNGNIYSKKKVIITERSISLSNLPNCCNGVGNLVQQGFFWKWNFKIHNFFFNFLKKKVNSILTPDLESSHLEHLRNT